jgi:hypothetical protein
MKSLQGGRGAQDSSKTFPKGTNFTIKRIHGNLDSLLKIIALLKRKLINHWLANCSPRRTGYRDN